MAVGKKTNKAGLGRKGFRLRSFAACVRKDICLFSSAAGIACLLLPFIAACLLAFGLNDALAAENVIKILNLMTKYELEKYIIKKYGLSKP